VADQNDDFELVRGSGNVFADFDAPDASLRQFRAILAAEIIKTLDSEGLTVRDAEARTGIAAADFSRIRQVKLDRFTIDRLMRILDRLNRDVRVKVSVAPRGRTAKVAVASSLAA
jgi:predicted XRE-type DNA-binding protein